LLSSAGRYFRAVLSRNSERLLASAFFGTPGTLKSKDTPGALVDGLREIGYIDGQTVMLDDRFPDPRRRRPPDHRARAARTNDPNPHSARCPRGACRGFVLKPPRRRCRLLLQPNEGPASETDHSNRRAFSGVSGRLRRSKACLLLCTNSLSRKGRNHMR
jgi:hypothetical protein